MKERERGRLRRNQLYNEDTMNGTLSDEIALTDTKTMKTKEGQDAEKTAKRGKKDSALGADSHSGGRLNPDSC
jgi:hypothetical protein